MIQRYYFSELITKIHYLRSKNKLVELKNGTFVLPKSEWKPIVSDVITKSKPLESLAIARHTEIFWRNEDNCHKSKIFFKSSIGCQQSLYVRLIDTSGKVIERLVDENEIMVSRTSRSRYSTIILNMYYLSIFNLFEE